MLASSEELISTSSQENNNTRHVGNFASEHLSPSFPERAVWGTAQKLRAWQVEALTKYFSSLSRDFLVSATPGSGKTTFALRLATELFARSSVERLIIVAPTEHLKHQWALAASRVGLTINPEFKNAFMRYGAHYKGIALTYAQIALRPDIHHRLTQSYKTLVILDEVHHAGETLSWGEALQTAFESATYRVLLTGTPFRSDESPIPFVKYEKSEQGVATCVTDYSYGYARALQDNVVRPVLFMLYDGAVEWVTRAGDHIQARLGEENTKDITSGAWRTALDPTGQWIPNVFRAANERLTTVRSTVPDAGGLVIASDRSSARAYARILEDIAGESVTVVLSDEKDASDQITRFAESSARWMVAVRMVSEGVDVPRLCVGVYATNASTPLYFAQVVGRFVRARRRGESACVFLPTVAPLIRLAAEIEKERDHVIVLDSLFEDEQDPIEEEVYAEPGDLHEHSELVEQALHAFEPIESHAYFDRVMYNGDEFGQYASPGSEEEYDFLGLPGILEPDQVHALLAYRHKRQKRRLSATRKQNVSAPSDSESSEVMSSAPSPVVYRTLKEQRQLLNSLVGLYAKNCNKPHAYIHAEIRRVCGGPTLAQASLTQIQARIEYLRKKLR